MSIILKKFGVRNRLLSLLAVRERNVLDLVDCRLSSTETWSDSYGRRTNWESSTELTHLLFFSVVVTRDDDDLRRECCRRHTRFASVSILMVLPRRSLRSIPMLKRYHVVSRPHFSSSLPRCAGAKGKKGDEDSDSYYWQDLTFKPNRFELTGVRSRREP